MARTTVDKKWYRATATCYTWEGKCEVVPVTRRWRSYTTRENAFRWLSWHAEKRFLNETRSKRSSLPYYERIYLHVRQKGKQHEIRLVPQEGKLLPVKPRQKPRKEEGKKKKRKPA